MVLQEKNRALPRGDSATKEEEGPFFHSFPGNTCYITDSKCRPRSTGHGTMGERSRDGNHQIGIEISFLNAQSMKFIFRFVCQFVNFAVSLKYYQSRRARKAE